MRPLLSLFPDLPACLLQEALDHPAYAPTTRMTYEEAAAPVIDAILSGGQSLPQELHELRSAISAQSINSPTAANTATNATAGVSAKVQRQNIWSNEELDVSKLRIKDDDDM